jgi:hypothetical protein
MKKIISLSMKWEWDFFLETDILKKEVQLGLAAIWDSINTLSILIFYFRVQQPR